MNDLITAATSGLFVEVGKVIEHMKAQASRIADLERQLAEASAPAVDQAPLGYLRQSEIDKMADHRVAGVGMMLHKDPGEGKVAVYTAPQAADTDKVREAVEAMNRAKLLPIWDNDVPHKLHVELDVIFKALSSMAAQAPVREVPGYKLVPVEPTQEMLKAGVKAFQHTWNAGEDNLDDWRANYRAMLAAARLPAAPVQQESE